jgi:transcriptional regulator with XRE-family HTH domain
MLSYLKESEIRLLRERRGWTQSMLAEFAGIGESGISRIETFGRGISDNAFANLMNEMNVPVETLFYPYLNTSAVSAYGLKAHILHCLYWGNHYPNILKKAEYLITELSNIEGFDMGANRQVVLRCLAYLYRLQGNPPDEILDITKEGIALTYPEFNPEKFTGNMLMFSEPELIQSQAIAYHRKGDTGKGIALLQQTAKDFILPPQDDRSRETLLAPIQLDLSRLLMESGFYDRAMEICNIGITTSNKRNGGKYTPEFTLLKAKILYHTGNKKECAALLPAVFASLILMRNQPMAKEVKEYANKLGMNFETFNMENELVNLPDLTTEYFNVPECKNIGDFFYALRDATGMNLEEAYYGICSKSILSKLENHSRSTSLFNMEALMQRYGVSTSTYFAVFASNKDFNALQLRNKVNIRLAQGLYNDETVALLNELAKTPHFKRNLGQHFIKSAEAELYSARNGYDNKHMEMLKDAWLTTRKSYDEENITKLRLMYSEVLTLNQIGINLCETGDLRRGVRLFEDLCTNIKRHYIDEDERMRILPAVLSNHAKYRGMMGDRSYALELATEGSEMCVKYGYMDDAAGFAVTIAYNMLELGDKEKSLPIFAQAFHALGLVGEAEVKERVRVHVKERLEVDLAK